MLNAPRVDGENIEMGARWEQSLLPYKRRAFDVAGWAYAKPVSYIFRCIPVLAQSTDQIEMKINLPVPPSELD